MGPSEELGTLLKHLLMAVLREPQPLWLSGDAKVVLIWDNRLKSGAINRKTMIVNVFD